MFMLSLGVFNFQYFPNIRLKRHFFVFFQTATSLASVYFNQRQACIRFGGRHGVLSGNSIHDALSSFLIYLSIQLENDKDDGVCHVPVILCLRFSVSGISV